MLLPVPPPTPVGARESNHFRPSRDLSCTDRIHATAYNCHNNRAVNLLCCLKNFLHCAVRNEWIEKNRFRSCRLKIDKTNVKVLLMKAELDLLPGWRSSKSFITEKIERAFY